MGTFLDSFRPDDDSPDFRRLWKTAKPLLREATVAVAPPYPEYAKLKVRKKFGATGDPACPSARDASDEVEVAIYAASGNGFGPTQERAWKYVLAHASTIEAALRRKLPAWHGRQLRKHQEEDLPQVSALRKYWKAIEGQVAWGEPSAVDRLFKLVGIGLADHGLDDCGFSSFELQTGWDRDHGLGVLMHRDRVLAVGGMTELIGSPAIAEAVRIVRTYDRDDGDFLLS